MTASRSFLSSLVIVSLSLGSALVAQAPALNLKLGLWENTIVTNMAGAAPVDTSKMTPEQAARIEAAMKAMAGDKTMTDKSCLKKEDLAKDSFMLPSNANMTCTRNITTNTSASYVAEIACTGQQEMKGQIRIDSQAGGTALTGTTKMTTTTRGRTMDVTMKMSGKYLGADCGTVK